jgi:ketosteroid isomerase-like protein
MSRENVEILRRVYDGWERGDFSEDDVFDPEVEFEMPDWPHGDKARGIEGMRRAWLASLSAWDDFRAEPDEFIDGGPHVVVLTRIHAWGKGSGAEVSADTAAVFTLDGGKVVRLVLYWDTAKALEVVGLRE